MKKKRIRKPHGQSLIEVMTAFFILIPIGLAGIDLVAFITSSQQNEQLAEMAARAAATQFDQGGAQIAAQDAIDHFQTTAVMSTVTLDNLKYDSGNGVVSVSTVMLIKMPVPLPYFTEANCRASSLQPIVSTPAPG